MIVLMFCAQHRTLLSNFFTNQNFFLNSNTILLVIYYLIKFDDVIESSFWVIPKTASANLCKPIYDINYSTSICPSVSGKCGKKGKKLQKFEYLEIEKSFLDEIKNTFHCFWRAIIRWENKYYLIKDCRHKF